MAAEPQLGSNNPFRKKGPANKVSPIPISSTVFDEIFTSESARTAAEASTVEAPAEPPVKAKVVKRVRVQSPPPSSPDTGPNTPADQTRGGDGEDGESSDSSGSKEDPFENAGTDDEGDEVDATEITTPTSLNRPPPNPFSKTLHDLEHGSRPVAEAPAAPTPPKGFLDVDAFRQLLLTGRTGSDAPHVQPLAASHANPLLPRDESSTDASSISRQSFLEPPPDYSGPTSSTDTPRTSHEIEPDVGDLGRSESATPVPQKKKPPPPSSRHGKLIKIELKQHQRKTPRVISPSDVNKPLPPAPIRKPVDEESTSIFDQESVGKVPEPSPTAVAPMASPLSKKPMPAPPPRRPRSDNKVPATAASGSHEDEPPRRSSSESTRSRADSARISYFAPAVPPPRRPHASSGGRLASSFASPSGQSFTSASTSPSISASDNDRSPLGFQPAHTTFLDAPIHVANVKLAPPPPPARNPSTRRPQSASSMESLNKRSSMGGKEPAPPPPPRRQRGGSRGSMESSDGNLLRRPSMDGPRVMPGTPVVEEPLTEVDEGSVEEASLSVVVPPRLPTPVTNPGHGDDILADLNALQREVNALQEQYVKSGGNPD